MTRSGILDGVSKRTDKRGGANELTRQLLAESSSESEEEFGCVLSKELININRLVMCSLTVSKRRMVLSACVRHNKSRQQQKVIFIDNEYYAKTLSFLA